MQNSINTRTEKIQLIDNQEDCCGCGACYNICPNNSIIMKEDELGFIYPHIDKESCIKCGACKHLCDNIRNQKNNIPIDTYVAITQNTDIKQSSSGGVFASLAKSTIEVGGAVYGASIEIISGKLFPMHIRVDDINDLIKLQGSKYVQSFIGSTFEQVKHDLNNNKRVLFSGTPCQIAGLKSFLKADDDNLLCVDLICHGVPSAKFFQDYISFLENKFKAKVLNFKFRDKSAGWGLTGKVILKLNGGKIIEKQILVSESSYYQLFLDSASYRDSCYKCKYANSNRSGDITIGDYWGIDIEHPELIKAGRINKADGVSCLLVNTDRGVRYLNEYHKGLLLYDSTFSKVQKHNRQLYEPSKMNNSRDIVFSIYKKEGYSGVERWFRRDQGVRYYVGKVKKIIPKKIKKYIKLILNK